ncbi:MAG TPA: bile acid:sodium symporter [candidate division Zixibacteria bacterium]|nr:bile acid:sodium symporter [candidate division Zixibacteria bacterium]
MSSLISRYFTSLVVVLSIVLGFVFPEVGGLWSGAPYLTLLLMFLMFFVTLSIEPNDVAQATRSYPVILVGLFTTFVLLPVLALSTKPFFPEIIYAGTMLALCCPSAIVSSFWTKVFKGDIATALVMSIVTNLVSIVTIPATMLIAVGTVLNVPVASMMLNLAEIILIPMTASFLLRRFVHIDWKRFSGYGSRVELGILVLVVWGSTASGVEPVRNNVSQFVYLNIFMLGIFALAFASTHFLTMRFGHKKAISIEISTTVKNAALSLVIGLATFPKPILPPLIANLIAQNLFLFPAKAITEKIAAHATLAHKQDQRKKNDGS